MKKILGILIIFLALFTIKVNAANDKINIKNVKVFEKSQDILVEDPILENDVISSQIKFNKIGDYVIYEVTLENKDDQDYKIEEIIDNNEISSLKIEYEYDKKIKKNNTHKIKIKMTYDSELPNSDNVSLDNLEIKLKLTDSTGLESLLDLTNPKTGEGLLKFLILIAISVAAIISVKKKQKVSKLFIFLIILLTPITIYAAENFELKFVFSNVELISNKIPARVGDAVENFGGYNWHVIGVDESSVTLMMDDGENGSNLLLNGGKMAHCTSGESTNCTPYVNYKNQSDSNVSSPTYSWKKSQINTYLNDNSEGSFLNNLESQIEKEIIPAKVCDDITKADTNSYSLLNEPGFPGYLENEIPENSCSDIGTYKVRLISRKEIDFITENTLLKDKSWLQTGNTGTQSMSVYPATWLGGPYMITTMYKDCYGAYYGTSTTQYIVRPVITIAQDNTMTESEIKQEIIEITNNYLESALEIKKNINVNRAITVSDISIYMTDKPTEGWVYFEVTDDGVKIKDYSLKIRDYVVDYSENSNPKMTLNKDGNVRQKPRTDYTIDGVKYYDGAHEAYFDPTGTDSNCSKNHYNTTGKTGCMKWYAYSEFEKNGTTYVNMLLNHNTTQKVEWISTTDYEQTPDISTLGITYPRERTSTRCWNGCGNDKGPITALRQLKNDTSNWNALPNRTDKYESYLDPYPNETTRNLLFTVDYSNYKARLFTLEEYQSVLLGNLNEKNEISKWLIENISTDGEPTYGYYSPSIGTYASNVAFGVGKGTNNDLNKKISGVRPVITVPKSSVVLD